MILVNANLLIYPIDEDSPHHDKAKPWLGELLLKTTGTAGNLVSDSHLAALALEQSYAIYSTDHDFKRFSGLTHVNPLE